jgi:hypothetical protein
MSIFAIICFYEIFCRSTDILYIYFSNKFRNAKLEDIVGTDLSSVKIKHFSTNEIADPKNTFY